MRSPGRMEVLEVVETRKEAEDIGTIFLSPRDHGKWESMAPGQFLMVWVPGIDEVPMSVSYKLSAPFKLGITVQDVGEATNAICSLERGAKIGIRGPYGNGFLIPEPADIDLIIGVSGGVGGASTVLAMEEAKNRGIETLNLVGARSKGLLLFEERWRNISGRFRLSTDDGSAGEKGFVTDLLREELDKLEIRDRTLVLTCGPEMMMKAVLPILEEYSVRGQFSLERYMKCGIGICDSCSVSGKRVCMDGPVFTDGHVRELKEFGKGHRDRSGVLIPVNECIR
ncbi:MAG: dihydroorotate dehydrogenase electron transfer subunit [Thermoplasmatota archaeon]